MKRILIAATLIVLTAGARAADSPALQAARTARATMDQAAKAKPANLYLKPGAPHRVEASLAFATGGSKLQADEWILYAALPPDLSGQHDVSYKATPDATKTAEAGGLKQPLLMCRIPADGPKKHVVGVSIEYALDLVPRRLTPLEPGQAPPKVADLSAEDRAAFTAQSELIDFAAPAFQTWLAKSDLRPAAGETDLDLARRVFLHLKEKSNFTFGAGTERRASRVCASMKSDCAGLTATFVAALRANGIPARQLVGRWATSAKKDETLNGKPWQQEHIQCEFYAANIGWLPVDVSVAVDFDKKPGSLEQFGNEAGRFIAFHLDADVQLDVPTLGRRPIRFLQEPACFFLGRGALDPAAARGDWVVRNARR